MSLLTPYKAGIIIKNTRLELMPFQGTRVHIHYTHYATNTTL